MNADRSIALAVRDLLIAANLSTDLVSIDPERIKVTYLPRYKLPELVDCHISIAPRGRARSRVSRVSFAREITLGVGIHMQCKPDSELLDALLDFATNVENTLASANAFLRSSVEELYSIEKLEQNNVFHCVISATYQAFD